MKALLCKAFGPADTLVIEDIDSPQIKKNEILLDVHAAGVNFPEIGRASCRERVF